METHPRLSALAFGCVIALVLVGALEAGFRIYEHVQKSHESKLVYSPSEFVQRDALLGAKPQAKVKVESHKVAADGKDIFLAHYTIDSHGRRVTPVESPSDRKYYAMFFGCSFTFGEGLNDNETLPDYCGKLAPCYKPYNYGYIGYGPQQMLAKLQSGTVSKEIPERKGILIYDYMGEQGVGHINRAIGSLAIYNWTRYFPYYHLDRNGNLVKSGNFTSGRPILSLFYRALLHSAIVRVLKIDYPFRLSEKDVDLTAKIMEESAKVYKKDFGSDAFYVLIFPGAVEWSTRRLVADLTKAGIKVLDYSHAKKFSGPEYRIAGDEHPSAKWNEELAKLVVKDLGLESSNCSEAAPRGSSAH